MCIEMCVCVCGGVVLDAWCVSIKRGYVVVCDLVRIVVIGL